MKAGKVGRLRSTVLDQDWVRVIHYHASHRSSMGIVAAPIFVLACIRQRPSMNGS